MASSINFSSETLAPAAPRRLTGTEWLLCGMAGLAFAFDTYEIVVMSLVVRPAVAELGPFQVGSEEFNRWVGLLFYIPAIAAGVLGLLGGYLTDRLGRRRVLVWSILLYCFSAAGAAYSTSLPALLALRCTTMVGVSVEFVAAVAWLAELLESPKQRESILAYTQAFSAVGGCLVTASYFLAVTYAPDLPAIAQTHEGWRYTLLFGTVPAIPLLIARPFLSESGVWRRLVLQQHPGRPGFGELFHPALRRTTWVSTLLTACSFGLAFGVIQQVPQIVSGLTPVHRLTLQQQEQLVSSVHIFTDLGDVAGRLLFAVLVVLVLRQRTLLRLFVLSALVTFLLTFFANERHDLRLLALGVCVGTCFTVGQFSFWGNYLPRMFPTRLRATGESFAINVGGRMIGASSVILTTQFSRFLPASGASTRLAYAAGTVAVFICLIGLLASCWLPEPGQTGLPK